MFLQIIQNVSLLLIAVFATYPLTEWLRGMGSELSRPIGIGFVLGSAAFLVSSVPIELHDGSVVDGRAGPMLFAGFLGGPVAGAVAAAIGAAARLIQGGPFALPGAFGFFIYAFAGVMLGLALRRAGKPARITTGNTVLLVLLSGVGLANTYWFIHPVELANAWFAGTMANVLLANAVSTVVMALAARFLTEAAENRRRVRLLNERLDVAARQTGLGLWEFDPDALTMRGNAQYARIFGCDCADVPIDFDSWLRYLDPADRASESPVASPAAWSASSSTSPTCAKRSGFSRRPRCALPTWPAHCHAPCFATGSGPTVAKSWNISIPPARKLRGAGKGSARGSRAPVEHVAPRCPPGASSAWMRWVSSPAGWRMTSTTFSPLSRTISN